MFSGDDKVAEFAGVGSLTGIFFFFNGLRMFFRYRAFARAREAPICSISKGLVGIHGKAKPLGKVLENSPVTHTPCLFYQVVIEKEVIRNTVYRWSPNKTSVGGLLFYLDDGSGKVLVNPFSAECDLLSHCEREVPASTSSPAAAGSIGDAQLIAYAGSAPACGVLPTDLTDNVPVLGLSTGRYRFTEYCILPEKEYYVTGTCIANPQPKDTDDRNMIVRGEKESTFLISWKSKEEEADDLRSDALYQILGGTGLAVVCLVIFFFKAGWL
jgi:hypothetical protein